MDLFWLNLKIVVYGVEEVATAAEVEVVVAAYSCAD
jgi:hypothetical protein